MTPIFFGFQTQGNLYIDDIKRFKEYLKTFGNTRLDIIIRKHRNKRSINQNNYAHGVVFKMIADELGYSTDDARDLCKTKFLKKTMPDGEIIVKSTTVLDTKQFEDFLEEVRRWALEYLQLSIPLPNEVDYE